MRISSEQRISNKPWEPAALEWKMPFASSHQSYREEPKHPPKLLQEVAKQELWQGKFQHIEHQQLYCVDEPHDLDAPSISMLFFPYEENFGD